MKVIANIIKLISFSIALKTVGTTTSAKTHSRGLSNSTSGSEYADMVPEKEQLVRDQIYESKWSKEPKRRASPTYVTYPVLRNGSTSHVQEQKLPAKQKKEEEVVDLLAAKYIEKMRKKLGYNSQRT
ncbi:hypothetical protein QN277_006758 [Acacia crassicarpa]|uniref:Uncharacterized protein n=1 Tax=Acacia crassicarpa TaxID=499986 RepID=A0AAE1IVL0_9FABA|nr:hypothetical protein QN277_006758 [Acacia crassicarpa]